MRIDVKKFLFLSPVSQKKKFFHKAQELGLIEFIPQTDNRSGGVQELPPSLVALDHASKILTHYGHVEQKEISCDQELDALAEKIVATHLRLQKLEEEARIVHLEIARIEPFGDFSLDEIRDIEKLSQRTLQFFVTDKKDRLAAVHHEHLIHVAHHQKLDYFLSIAPHPTSYEGMTQIKIEKTLGELRSLVHQQKEEGEKIVRQFRDWGCYLKSLERAFARKIDFYHLYNAEKSVGYELEDQIFTVEGWVAVSHRDQVMKLCHDYHVICEEVAIENSDRTPTYLHNEGLGRIGQDLVNIYEVPSSNDKDPSLFVLFAFLVFFSVIIGDGGYGLLFLTGALFAKFKLPKLQGGLQRMWKLFFILSCGCILWGVATGQFFGVKWGLEDSVRKYSVLHHFVEVKSGYHLKMHDETYQEWLKKYPQIAPATNGEEVAYLGKVIEDGVTSYPIADECADSILMEFALILGILHTACGLIWMLKERPHGIGWILFLIGAYLYFPSFLGGIPLGHMVFNIDQAFAVSFGKMCVFAGIGLAVLIAVIKQKFMGLIELSVVIQVFSDVLSYLRLYALGLAGGMVSATFNDMGASIMPWGILVIVAGHFMNLVLGIIGGVIHGLRLNFLEWYHYCFEGGGKMFKPLELSSKNNFQN